MQRETTLARSTDGSRRSWLRAETSVCHDDLERAMDARGYFASLPAYGDYLQRLHLFYGHFCTAMQEAHAEALQRWHLPLHRDWLVADLAHFRLEPLPAAGALVPLRIDGPAPAYGAAYVVLGSALGARVLAKRARALRPAGAGGFTYLEGLAASRDWTGFLADLESEPSLTPAELLRGALETFASFKHHMIGSLAR